MHRLFRGFVGIPLLAPRSSTTEFVKLGEGCGRKTEHDRGCVGIGGWHRPRIIRVRCSACSCRSLHLCCEALHVGGAQKWRERDLDCLVQSRGDGYVLQLRQPLGRRQSCAHHEGIGAPGAARTFGRGGACGGGAVLGERGGDKAGGTSGAPRVDKTWQIKRARRCELQPLPRDRHDDFADHPLDNETARVQLRGGESELLQP